MVEMKMPEDWHDQKGWENYYASLLRDNSLLDDAQRTGSISIDRMPQFIEELNSNNFSKVWVSGCGLSLMPKLLARGGLNVHATDISSSAIAFQGDDDHQGVNALLGRFEISLSGSGSLTAEI